MSSDQKKLKLRQVGTATADNVEQAAWLFEQMALEVDVVTDRARIVRAHEEIAEAWPGDPQDRWWKWVVEASHSLGRRCKVVDCTFDQVVEVANEGGQFIVRVPESDTWLAVTATRRGKFCVIQPLVDDWQQWVTQARLRKMLCATDPGVVIRCVILQPFEAALPDHPDGQQWTPLRRFLALMRPESADMWSLFVVALVSGMLAMATPLAVEALVMTVAFGRYLQPIVILALMLFVFLAFRAALSALQTYMAEIIQRRLFARVAADLSHRLPRVLPEALDNQSGRELANRFFDIVTVQKVAAEFLIDALTLAITTFVGMVVLAFYHPWLLGFDLVLLAMLAIMIFVLGSGAVKTKIKESKMKYKMAAWLEDLAGCGTTFHYDGAAEFALERTDGLIAEYLLARKKHFRIFMRQFVFALAVQAIASTVLLGMGGWLVITGQLTLGQLVASELIVVIIVAAFVKFGKHIGSYYDLMAAIDKLGVLFDLPTEKEDGMLTAPMVPAAKVCAHAVTYSYPQGHQVLDGVTFDVESGQRWGLTGPSGCGKSLLIDLLFGLRAPTFGHLTINGIDPRDLRPDVLRRMSALVRTVEIFDGTVAENVHLERPDITTSDVRDVLELVGLLPAVLRLSNGLETHLCSTGSPLTKNQQRKLMLARAIAGRPCLLLVDGLLDGLPDEEAEQILDILCDESAPWSLIVVTGRKNLLARLQYQLTFTGAGKIQSIECHDREALHVDR